VAVPLTGFFLAVVLPAGYESEERLPKGGEMILTVSSSAVQEGDAIPTEYDCEGQDVSPPLAWGMNRLPGLSLWCLS